MGDEKKKYMQRAIEIAIKNAKSCKGGPFGAVVVKNGKIIGEGTNMVTETNDPTAHAEIVAIRRACQEINDFQLEGCEIYSSCEPCPMCLGAIYWARPKILYYAATQDDAANAGFDDSFIYQEFELPNNQKSIKIEKMNHEMSYDPFDVWGKTENRVEY